MLQFENERNLEVVVIARVLIQTNGIIAFDLFDPILGCIWVRMEVKFCGAIIILEYKRAVISELR